MADIFTKLTTGVVAVAHDSIDTDQIFPARFMTTISRDALGNALFYDARRAASGRHPLDATYMGQKALLGGKNFGCGSSREHAVWAILDFGFRVVLAPSFGDIFRSNALNNGLLALVISDDFYQSLLNRVDPQITVDLENSLISSDRGERQFFSIDPFNKYCLTRGMDRLDYLLEKMEKIRAYERTPNQK